VNERKYESEFQAELCRELEAQHHVVFKIEPGTGTIPKGWPDLEILYGGGVTMRCEVKTYGGEVTPAQRRQMHLLALSGHKVCFCDPRPEFCWPTPMTVEEIDAYEPPKSG
jgi:hypothetical protein